MLGDAAKSLLGLSAMLGLLLSSAPASATPQDLFGYGAHSPGLAMSGVATCSGYECVFVNPAGLSRSETTSLYRGSTLRDKATLDDERPLRHYMGQHDWVSTSIHFGGSLEDRIAIGAAFYATDDIEERCPVRRGPAVCHGSRAHVVAIRLGAR